MKRIMVLGMSGAGKSTLARMLGDKFGLPVTHLDNVYHEAGFVPRPDAEAQKDFDAIAAMDKWAVDGNYSRLSTALRARAEMLIFLDFGRFYCLGQIFRRSFLHRLGWQKRVDLKHGLEDGLRWDFLVWVWHWRRDSRPKWMKELQHLPPERVRIFTNRKEVMSWLKTL